MFVLRSTGFQNPLNPVNRPLRVITVSVCFVVVHMIQLGCISENVLVGSNIAMFPIAASWTKERSQEMNLTVNFDIKLIKYPNWR